MDLVQVLLAGVIGLLAGVLGGLAGIGGSLIMLPGLGLILGYRDPAHTEHHVYMAAAMCVNVLVAFPAAAEHRKAGFVRKDLLIYVLPCMAAAMVAGVLVSNIIDGLSLKRILAAFITLYCVLNIARVVRGRSRDRVERAAPPRLVASGLAGGFVGGLLGLGGGVVLVPLLQVLGRVRLREAIATSSATMAVTSIIGAVLKLATLKGVGHSPLEAFWLALAMGPAAVLGATLGARLAHRLPLPALRIVISVLLLLAAAKLADIDRLLGG